MRLNAEGLQFFSNISAGTFLVEREFRHFMELAAQSGRVINRHRFFL